MKAIAYTRFSPRPDEDACNSLESQEIDIRAYCEARGMILSAVHSDRALSGADSSRPGLAQAIAELGRGDVLVVRNVNRLSRDLGFALFVENELKRKGAMLHSVEDGGPLKDDPAARFIRNILYSLAEYQRAIGNARTSSKMRMHQRNGRLMSRHPPYGWKAHGKKLVEHPQEQENIKIICQLRKEDGMGYLKIANELEKRKIKPRKKYWHPSTVLGILKRAGAQ